MIRRHIKKIPLLFLAFFGLLIASCEETLFETDISETNVQLLAPSDGSLINFTSINFDWEPVFEADQYQIQIATPNFDNPVQIVQDVILDSTTTFSAQLNPDFYQWRVKAINSAYETLYTTASFEIRNNDEFSDNVVVLVNPENNLIINTANFVLQWNPILDATQYRVQVLNNENGQVVFEETTEQTTLSYTFNEGDFTWQVRAEKDTEFTQYSAHSILVDQTIPNTPGLTTPEDAATLDNENVDFSWTRTPIAGSVEIDSLYIYSDVSLEVLVEKRQVENPYQTTLSNGMYYWQMKAFDQAGNQGNESSVFSFTVDQ